MNKKHTMFSKKVIGFITSVSVISVVGVSVAFASITFNNTSITGDSSFNSIVGVVSTTWDLGAATTLSLQTTNNGAITTGSGLFTLGGSLAYLNASGTNVTASGYLQGATINVSTGGTIVNVSSTRIDATTGGTIANISSTNINASGFGTFPTLNFTSASGTSITASSFLQGATLNISGQSQLTSVSSTRLDATTGGTIANISSTNINASGFGTFPTLNFTSASGTQQTLSGYLTVTGNLRNAAHVNSTGTIPGTPTACGTSPTVVGTDNAFLATVGTGAGVSACTIPFATAFASKPVCTVTNLNTSTQMLFQASSTTSNISINALSSTSTAVSTAFINQVQFAVVCIGKD